MLDFDVDKYKAPRTRSNTGKRDPTDLPLEIIIKIFKALPKDDFSRIRLTLINKKFATAAIMLRTRRAHNVGSRYLGTCSREVRMYETYCLRSWMGTKWKLCESCLIFKPLRYEFEGFKWEKPTYSGCNVWSCGKCCAQRGHDRGSPSTTTEPSHWE